MIRLVEVDPVEWLERARPLFEASYYEVMQGVGIPPPQIDMDTFTKLVEMEMALAVVALTAEDEIIGYTFSYLVPLFLYGGMKVMNNESLFVRADHRGITSVRLIRATEVAAKARGAARMQWHTRPGTKAEGLFSRMKYHNFDNAWSKEL